MRRNSAANRRMASRRCSRSANRPLRTRTSAPGRAIPVTVSLPTVYLYFRSKPALVRSLADLMTVSADLNLGRALRKDAQSVSFSSEPVSCASSISAAR